MPSEARDEGALPHGEEEERRAREREIEAQKERVEHLLGEALALRQASEIRAYVEAVRSANASVSTQLPEEAVEAWATWALAEADQIDPIRSGQFLSQFVPVTLSSWPGGSKD